LLSSWFLLWSLLLSWTLSTIFSIILYVFAEISEDAVNFLFRLFWRGFLFEFRFEISYCGKRWDTWGVIYKPSISSQSELLSFFFLISHCFFISIAFLIDIFFLYLIFDVIYQTILCFFRLFFPLFLLLTVKYRKLWYRWSLNFIWFLNSLFRWKILAYVNFETFLLFWFAFGIWKCDIDICFEIIQIFLDSTWKLILNQILLEFNWLNIIFEKVVKISNLCAFLCAIVADDLLVFN